MALAHAPPPPPPPLPPPAPPPPCDWMSPPRRGARLSRTPLGFLRLMGDRGEGRLPWRHVSGSVHRASAAGSFVTGNTRGI